MTHFKAIVKSGLCAMTMVLLVPGCAGVGQVAPDAATNGEGADPGIVVAGVRKPGGSSLEPSPVPDFKAYHGLDGDDEPVEYVAQPEYRDAVIAALKIFSAEHNETFPPLCVVRRDHRPAVRNVVRKPCGKQNPPVGAVFVSKAGDKVSINLALECVFNWAVYEQQGDGIWLEIDRYYESNQDCDMRLPDLGGE